MAEPVSRASTPSLTMAYSSLLLACAGVVLSIVALVGVWWHGQINPTVFGGVFKGEGSLSLWGFSSSADLLGFTLPAMDGGACGNSSPLREQETCGKLHAIRGLVISSAVFMGFALISAICALFTVGKCCHGKYRVRSQLATALMALLSVACMISALAVGSSSDISHVMLDFGAVGAAFYCAVAQILVGFVVVNISCIGGCAMLKGNLTEDARGMSQMHNSEGSGV
eukprot:CAMPEP_0114689666 /NCGR_PEP_ID=MMETSP0191-20121206/64822_1 /TAXON_ID=126664 /ORGANISM="Sorites sp." /LENGTH=225 /DNA_ID=CAMNT_0001978609 /DNA_START=35 /DNA_END=713 /DNA_ORIENTATION=+